MSLREKILSTKLKITEVKVPDWGEGPFFVRSLSGIDYAKMRAKTQKLQPEEAAVIGEIWLALFALCDEEGKRILGDNDFASFSEQPVTVITSVVKQAMITSGMDIEQAKKDSGQSQN